MGIAYTIDEARGVSFALWDGLITAADWLAHVRRLTSEPQWPPSRALHLADIRTAGLDGSINEAAFREAAALYGRHKRFDGLKAAIVAGDAYPAARLFEDVIGQHGAVVIAFNSLNPACDWLGIDTAHASETLATLYRDR